MKKIGILSMLILITIPSDLLAFRDHRSATNPRPGLSPTQPRTLQIPSRRRMPIKLPMDEWDPGRQVRKIHRGHKPIASDAKRHGRHRYRWPTTTTVVREVQPIIVVNNPPPALAAPSAPTEPKKVWVPPVMDTRLQPGYWDYGIIKMWMGDHWRYEQNFEERTWVPASEVTYVKQEGYWKFETGN
jgi:hypothetical protein